MNEKLKDQDVLLVTEKDSTNPKVVTGLSEDGTPKAVEPKKENEPDFLKIDKNSDALENFMSNFMLQCKEPTHFHFFKVPADGLNNIVNVLSTMLKDPENPSNKKFMNEIRVLPEAFAKKPYQPIDESRINWSQFENVGVTRDMIDKKTLDNLLNWQKTPILLPIKTAIGDSIIRTDARLSLRESADGKLNLVVHAVRKEPQLDGFVYGVRLTEEDKQNLRQTGHAGRLVEIEPVKDQKMQAFLSVDKLTNELVAVRADKIKIPNEVKGVILNDEQKKELSEGKAVYLEGMKSKNDKEFNATVQINADHLSLEFKFDNTQKQGQSQNQQQQSDTTGFRIPTKLLGAELSEQQQKDLTEHKTIYVTGMTDKAGEKFNAYIKVNTEKEKLDFFKWNPDRAKKQGAEVTPDNASKAQVAVNSEGKTNKATKDIKEPLKKGQTVPSEKQQEQQQEKKEVKKSKGMKM